MLDIRVAHVAADGTRTSVDVQVVPRTTVWGVLMQARSQGLAFDLDASDVVVGSETITTFETTRFVRSGTVEIRARRTLLDA